MLRLAWTCCTAEGLANIEFAADEDGEPQHVYIGEADVQDCFHRMRIGVELGR